MINERHELPPSVDHEILQALKDFAVAVLDGYRTGIVGDIDGGWLQDKALELGLIVDKGLEDDPNYYLADCLTAHAAAPQAELNAKQIRKGTGDVLKDMAYAQRFTESIQNQIGGRTGLEIDFVDRALRVGMNEIRLLRDRLKVAPQAPLCDCGSPHCPSKHGITLHPRAPQAPLEEKPMPWKFDASHAVSPDGLSCVRCGVVRREYAATMRCPYQSPVEPPAAPQAPQETP